MTLRPASITCLTVVYVRFGIRRFFTGLHEVPFLTSWHPKNDGKLTQCLRYEGPVSDIG
jgi:hypothetical protein